MFGSILSSFLGGGGVAYYQFVEVVFDLFIMVDASEIQDMFVSMSVSKVTALAGMLAAECPLDWLRQLKGHSPARLSS